MPQFIADTDGTVCGTEWSDLSPFVQGYIECILFTETASGISMVDWRDPENVEDVREGRADGNIPGDTGFGDIHPDTLAGILSDCHAFESKARHLLSVGYARGYSREQAGNDFWYTRNGHGVGYWDRDVLDGTIETPDLHASFGSPRVDEPNWSAYAEARDNTIGNQLSDIAKEFGEVNAWFSEVEEPDSPTGYGFMYLE